MASKTHPLFSNFSAGEISPKLDARVDLAQYFSGASEIKNFVCVQQGGVKARGGFHFVSESKYNNSCRLIPFQFSELQNYMLLFGEKYIWFYTDSGQVVNKHQEGLGIPSRITSDTRSTTSGTDFTDRFAIYHGQQVPGAQVAYSNTSFLGGVIQTNEPYQVDTPYEVELDLWSIRFAQDDENLYLVHPLYPPMVLTKGVGHTFTLSEVEFTDGPYEDAIESPTLTPSATTGEITLTASSPMFLDDHVGALWRLNHATVWSWVKITGITSSTVATATVKSAVTVAGATTSHREGAWSDINGWPKQICFNEGRLLFASNYEHAQTIWGSKTNDYVDFTPGVLDNESYTFAPANLNIIRWILSGRELNIGALNAEATAVGPTDSAISPASPPIIKSATSHGSSDVTAPVRVGNSIIFLQRANRKIREFTYSFSTDAYGAPDLTLASEQMFNSDIIDIIYQQEPDSLIWAIRNDTEGSILTCAYDRTVDPSKGGIVAWSRHYTDGRFESIASIPNGDEDQVWVVVHREIGGVDKRYIEYYDEDISVDSGLTYSGGDVTTLSGLDHLIGKTVRIIGDGATYPDQVVSAGGTLTIDPAASDIYVGLAYSPKLITNRPEVAVTGGGSSQGLKKRWNKITVRVLDTTGITINGEVYPSRETEDEMDSAPGTYTEDLSITNLGWSTEAFITIEQPLSLPAHIVAVFGTLVVGDD
jgi:hypothetical protein